MSIHRWMDKQNVYTHNEILINLKGNSDTYHNIDEPWELYAKWNKPVTKISVLYDFIYMRYLVYKLIDREKVEWVVVRAVGSRSEAWLFSKYGVSVLQSEKALVWLRNVNVLTTTELIHLKTVKMVNTFFLVKYTWHAHTAILVCFGCARSLLLPSGFLWLRCGILTAGLLWLWSPGSRALASAVAARGLRSCDYYYLWISVVTRGFP